MSNNLFEAVNKAFDESKLVENEKYRCIKSMSHPNMGVMFKKGKVYELTDDRGEEVTVGGWNIYKKFLDTNFEKVSDTIKEDEDKELNTVEEYIFDMYTQDDELPEYEDFNDWIMQTDKKTFDKASKNVQDIVSKIKTYTIDRTHKMLELSDNRTMYQLDDNGKTDEDWYNIVKAALEAFEVETGVTLYAEGRMNRHMCVEYNYENAKRYDELVSVCKKLETEAVNNFNTIDPVNENYDTKCWLEIDGKKVEVGDTIKDFRGEEHIFTGITKPGTPFGGMSGKVQVKKGDSTVEYYPGVFNGKIVGEHNSDLKEQIIADGTESEIRTLMADIKVLADTIKHTVEDEIISINARIARINESNGLLLDSIDADGIYTNLSEVVRDMDYALKNSEWSKEEQNESENLKESETNKPTLDELAVAIKEIWDNPNYPNIDGREVQSSGAYKEYFKDKYNWDVSSSALDMAWDRACELGGVYDDEEDEGIEIDGVRYNSKEDAYRWLKSKLAEYGNTYYFNNRDQQILKQLTNKFGNTYFWR